MTDTLGNYAYTGLAFIFVLGVMIFAHELGHFLVAKMQKIRVHTFSLGFGPRLWGFRRGDTDYRVSLLPLGGYVKMAGENYDETITGAPDEFLSRPKYQRFLVAIAGPAMNILLAVVLLAVYLMYGVEVPKYLREPAIIGRVKDSSPAEKAGLKAMDLVVAIDGKPTPTWEDLQLSVGSSPRQELAFDIQRGGQRLSFKVMTTAQGKPEIGDAGVLPDRPPPQIEKVEPGAPAEKAGLQTGDVIEQVSYQDQVAKEATEIQALTTRSEGKELEFTLRRGDEIIRKKIVPVKLKPPPGENGPVPARVGFSFKREATVVEHYGFFAAFKKSLQQNYQYTVLTFEIIKKLLIGKLPLSAVSGPVDIAYYSGEAARLGLRAFMAFMAIISLQLGVFNLLPIPVLDGGMIFLLLLEGVMRRDFSLRVKEKIVEVGLVFLMLLMGVVIFNDIGKHFFK